MKNKDHKERRLSQRQGKNMHVPSDLLENSKRLSSALESSRRGRHMSAKFCVGHRVAEAAETWRSDYKRKKGVSANTKTVGYMKE